MMEKDPTGEGNDLRHAIKSFNIGFVSDPGSIGKADFVIICVPTPIKEGEKPDLSFIESAGATVGNNLKKGSVVVLESTVYPGVTEDVLGRAIMEKSGMECPQDFSLGYSPERINPGDKEHTLERIVKVVGGIDDRTASILSRLYGNITKAGTFKARDIKTAEAAKVIENIQRDLNIALVNEFSLIFKRLGINVHDVLAAAQTKWNFHRYSPGLVGGHCIGIDPYYLVHAARKSGYEPRVILSGREINNSMSGHVAGLATQALERMKKKPGESKVLLLGLSFKKNVNDIRNSPSRDVIAALKERGVQVICHDPLIESKTIESRFGSKATESIEGLTGIDCIILMTGHDAFRKIGMETLKAISSNDPVLIDVRAFFDPDKCREAGFYYEGL